MSFLGRYILSLHTLEKFTNDALHLTPHSNTLSGFHYNKELLKAASSNTYLETVGNRADSLHLAIERSSIKDIKDSMFSRIIALSKPLNFQGKNVIIAFDYTYWDFYGGSSSPWVRGWTGENGIRGKFYFLTASVVNSDLRLPLISIPSTVINTTAYEIISIMNVLKSYFRNIDLLLFDRWFYSKEIIMSLNNISNYLIFVKKDSDIKRELESMEMGEKKIKIHEFSMYRDGKRIRDSTYIAFLKQIFDHRTEEYYDWAFATNIKEVNLDEIIGKYKIRWRIENMFRVQDEATIKSKSLNINVRYFLFAYEQLLEAIWYIYYSKEVSFKRFVIEMSDACTAMVNNEEKKRAIRH